MQRRGIFLYRCVLQAMSTAVEQKDCSLGEQKDCTAVEQKDCSLGEQGYRRFYLEEVPVHV